MSIKFMRARCRQANWRRILRNNLSVEIVEVFLKPCGGVVLGMEIARGCLI
jgi:hypothetical protein